MITKSEKLVKERGEEGRPEDARGAFGAPMLLAWRHGRPECSPAPDSGTAKTRAEGTVLTDTLDEAKERRGGRGRSPAPLRGRLGRIHTSAGRGQPGVVARAAPVRRSIALGPLGRMRTRVAGHGSGGGEG
jgi:hypothetical protein